jgi:bifunctional non-homologous end joining protein LigD
MPGSKSKTTRRTPAHPRSARGSANRRRAAGFAAQINVPRGENRIEFRFADRAVALTNLHKPFWPELGITKGDLLQYYADVSRYLLPHLKDRAMVMKRYPNGAAGNFFFMKRAPVPRPQWIKTCSIEHSSGSIIAFPMIQDLLALLWVVNLGCIDLNPWYARCDDADRPDYLHFDLDPVKGATFEQVLEAALIVRDALAGLKMPSLVKTTGSRGVHVYVPIVRGPNQSEVWAFSKSFALGLERLYPKLITAEYKVEKRPAKHVLVDYNQNAWGRTLASVYSVRPHPRAAVSAPITWQEVEGGVRIEDFRMDNIRERLQKVGDLWSPLLATSGRVKLERFLRRPQR